MTDSVEQSGTSTPPDGANDFLLLEYQSLYTHHENQKEVGEKRLNFYIAVTAGIGSITIAAQEFIARELGIWLLIGGMTIILSLGMITFRKMLQRRVAIIIMRRRSSRIRAWFCEHYPSIVSALPFSIDEELAMDWGKNRLGSTAYSVAFINTAIVVFVVAATMMTAFGSNAVGWSVPAAAMSGAITWWLHLLWKNSWMNSAETHDQRQLRALNELKERVEKQKSLSLGVG